MRIAKQRTDTTRGIYINEMGTDRRLGGTVFYNPDNSTAITGATETATNFDNSQYTIPANSLKVGTIIELKFEGIYTATTGAETHQFAVRYGTTSLGTTGNIDPATNDIFYVEWSGIVRSIGATGSIVGCGIVRSGSRNAAGAVNHFIGTGSGGSNATTIDTTADTILAVSVDRQAGATDSDSMRGTWSFLRIEG